MTGTGYDLRGIGMTSQRTRNRLVARLRERGIDNDAVLEAMAAIPRHIFVDEALAHRAYEETALPIGHGQTISQPFVVARMTAALLEAPRRRVLEVGAGSGYQTAILAALVGRVFAVERVEPFVERARERLAALGCGNVRMRHGDGYEGWTLEAPFDGILVAAAPATVPAALLEQLADGGRLILPVGSGAEQQLKIIDRIGREFVEQVIEPVRFVPLTKGMGAQ